MLQQVTLTVQKVRKNLICPNTTLNFQIINQHVGEENGYFSVSVMIYGSSTRAEFFSTGKPRIVIPSQVIRTVPDHYVWCSSDGAPPINMSFLNSSVTLAESVGTVMSRIHIDGNYTCHATNEFGTDSKTFHVSVIGKITVFVWTEK